MAKRNYQIQACTKGPDGELLPQDVEFADYTEFKKWVKAQQQNGVTFIPVRQVGPELTYRTVEVGRLA